MRECLKTDLHDKWKTRLIADLINLIIQLIIFNKIGGSYSFSLLIFSYTSTSEHISAEYTETSTVVTSSDIQLQVNFFIFFFKLNLDRKLRSQTFSN